MRRSAHAPRVWLNPVSVWESLDRLGISQNELARRCGFSQGHLSMLMNGKRSPSPRARRRLMEVLGVDDFDLLFITEPWEAVGHAPSNTGALTRKKGRTEASSADGGGRLPAAGPLSGRGEDYSTARITTGPPAATSTYRL